MIIGKVFRVRVLVLGGTAQARELAAELHGREGCRVVSSLAGRVSRPALPEGEVRIGGFGGAGGLADYLRDEAIEVLIDATHPFAQVMSGQAAQAAEATGVRLIALRRPGWSPETGDRWIHVADIAEAARHAADLPDDECVFVTTGRGGLEQYAGDERHDYLIRTVDPPTETLPPRHVVVLDRGPYTVDGETALMERHGVSVLVTKNSGGSSTEAKLVAARRRGIPVVMIEPPAPRADVESVGTVAQAVGLLGFSGTE